eukprot:GHVN01000308.1.p1 GENE.GHVN01000308.1~~GHVN01000308.1.p1  ORF type:complete len:164 (+),score=18.76 GHVN01000308.1:177-668(+)
MQADLAKLFPLATAQKNELEALLEQFVSQHKNSIPVQQRLVALTAQYSHLAQQIAEKYESCKGDMDKTTHDNWERRVQKLRSDATQFKTSLDKQLDHLHQSQMEAAERARLFRGAARGDSANALQREQRALMQSSEIIDSTIQQGTATVNSLSYQTRILKVGE